jgi:hypothetical protein
MSWSISASGPANKVAVQLEQQFTNINCSDPGEQATVQNVRALVAQTLSTIDPDKPVQVTGSGSMGYKEWSSQSTRPHVGPFQSVDLKISPIHFSV